jgi:hypothetical protein
VPSFSLAALTALELAPPGLIDVAAACGYDHVGIRLLPATPGGTAYPLMEDEASLRETIARLDAIRDELGAAHRRAVQLSHTVGNSLAPVARTEVSG